MTVAFTAPEIEALESIHCDLLYFVELHFDEATERLHNGIGTYTWGGHDWLGIGDFGSISPIEEAEGFSPYELTLELSGVNDDILAIAEAEPLFERRVVIYIGVIDPNHGVNLLADPKQRFAGNMQTSSITLGSENKVVVSVESELKFYREVNGSRWTDEQQQTEFATDQAFEYLPQLQDAKIQWGPGGSSTLFGTPPPFEPPATPSWDSY